MAMGWDYSVPGALWPGAALPGQVITGTAPPSVAPPVIFRLGTARHLWTAATARNNEGGGMFLTQPAVSLQAVQVMVSALQNGAPYDFSGDPVSMAFVVNPAYGTAPAPAASSEAWNAATWETDPGPAYWATCLVGPGAVSLTAGTAYTVYLKITSASSGEVPVIPGPALVIT
jgi:hypothetical protein